MQKLFITSSGTNVGKTIITCALLSFLSKDNNVKGMKPIISGFKFNEVPNDISLIANSSGVEYSKENIKNINFKAFEKPLSPDMAADKLNQEPIDYDELKNYIEVAAKNDKKGFLVVETVGGVMVPINPYKTFLDLTSETADEVILVVGSYLGSLSHSLSAYKNLCQVNKKPCLVIITQSLSFEKDLYIDSQDTLKSLENFIDCPIVLIDKEQGEDSTIINNVSIKLANEEKVRRIFK